MGPNKKKTTKSQQRSSGKEKAWDLRESTEGKVVYKSGIYK